MKIHPEARPLLQGEADEEPIWARSEKFAGAGLGTPSLGFGVYLLGSAIVSIAAVSGRVGENTGAGRCKHLAPLSSLLGKSPPGSP